MERSRATSKAWRDSHPLRARAWERRSHLKQYGLTVETFAALLRSQSGGCAACGGPPNGKGNTFHVDHDHSTGAIRGLLCHNCNAALGLLKERQERITMLSNYIARHGSALTDAPLTSNMIWMGY